MRDEQIEAACDAFRAEVPEVMIEVWGDDMRRGMRAALEASEAVAWRPIEEAPKHGGEVDLWCVDGAGNSRRCPSCSWEPMTDWMGNEYEGWCGVRDGYRPVAWRLSPEPPR